MTSAEYELATTELQRIEDMLKIELEHLRKQLTDLDARLKPLEERG